jgi:TonB family protein
MPLEIAKLSPHYQETDAYHLTILNDAGLLSRLTLELRFLDRRLRTAWPAFKEHPLEVTRSASNDLFRALMSDHRRLATAALASCVVALTILFVLFSDRPIKRQYAAALNDSEIEILSLSPPSTPREPKPGVGAGSKGRVGFDVGAGEGSLQERKSAHGGGSGGERNKLKVNKGSVPPPSEIPAPIPTVNVRKNPALPAAGIDIDPALWRDLPAPVYGDPRSQNTVASNGPGDGGGIGTHSGLGIGDGDGDGFGPGRKGNIGGGDKAPGGGKRGGGCCDNANGEEIFRASTVSQRARVLAKPEPQYTEEARRNQITGTVVLRVVFSKSGEVTNIRAVNSLPFGLTERAIAAARQIRFVPATKDNLPVSVHMQLEYNFNLY